MSFVLLLLLSGLSAPAGAYETDDIVGRPSMLLTAVSGNGSLTGESTLGSAVADAVRRAAQSDFAVVCGGELVGNLEPKSTTFSTIFSLFLDGNVGLAVAKVTAAQLKTFLEWGLSHIELDETESINQAASAFAGFPQVAGMKLTYDASAKPGERIMRIETDRGQIDLSDDRTVYTLAATLPVITGEWGDIFTFGYYELDTSLAEAMADFVAEGTPDHYTGRDRIIAVGCTEHHLVNQYPLVPCAVAACLIFCATRLWKFKQKDDFTASHWTTKKRIEERL